MDTLIDGRLRSCPFTAIALSRFFRQMQIIQSEIHRAKNNINTLKQHMIMGFYFTNISFPDVQSSVLLREDIGQAAKIILECTSRSGLIGQFVQ